MKKYAIVGNIGIRKSYRTTVKAKNEAEAKAKGEAIFREMLFEDMKDHDFELSGEIKAVRIVGEVKGGKNNE